jgi:hypothetical protein
LLNPLLKLFFNPNKVVEALHIQSRLNESYNRSEALYYELIHNLVLETTRLGVEVKNLKMRLESISSRLDFDERRARALEGVVQYRPGTATPLQPPTGQNDLDNEGNERRTRRRRRRGRRRGPEDRGPMPEGRHGDAGGGGSEPHAAGESHDPSGPEPGGRGPGDSAPPADQQ